MLLVQSHLSTIKNDAILAYINKFQCSTCVCYVSSGLVAEHSQKYLSKRIGQNQAFRLSHLNQTIVHPKFFIEIEPKLSEHFSEITAFEEVWQVMPNLWKKLKCGKESGQNLMHLKRVGGKDEILTFLSDFECYNANFFETTEIHVNLLSSQLQKPVINSTFMDFFCLVTSP